MPGYVQLYTGEGKGKTTAALGLALHASGAGMKVFLAQFCKSMRTSEIVALERRFADCIVVRQFGDPWFPGCCKKPETDSDRNDSSPPIFVPLPRSTVPTGAAIDLRASRIGRVARGPDLGRVCPGDSRRGQRGDRGKLFSVDDLLGLIDARHPDVELVLTGRDADPRTCPTRGSGH